MPLTCKLAYDTALRNVNGGSSLVEDLPPQFSTWSKHRCASKSGMQERQVIQQRAILILSLSDAREKKSAELCLNITQSKAAERRGQTLQQCSEF